MTEAEALTIQLLKQIDQKLKKLIKASAGEDGDHSFGAVEEKSYSARAEEIAAMTPQSTRQTDAVELLHEDRSR
jgi:hypothetical protein